MFYKIPPDPVFRFGDIVQGFALSEPIIDKPPWGAEFMIGVQLSAYSVVVSPCCSIGEMKIALSPLLPIDKNWLRNPYFREDLTNINRMMEPEQSLSPTAWASLPPQDREKRIAAGRGYAFYSFFVYQPAEFLLTYKRNVSGEEVEIGHYAIDFRNIHKVNSKSIQSPENVPIEMKKGQLTIDSRSELRAKMSFYFARPAVEDLVV